MLRQRWDVDGAPTTVLRWVGRQRFLAQARARATASASDSTPTLLLFVPGNPGPVDYYARFLDAVWRRSGGHIDIVAGIGMGLKSSIKAMPYAA